MTTRVIAVLVAAAISLIGPAGAADNVTSTTAPDLTAVRALIKAKEFAKARDELNRIADGTQHADVYNLLGFTNRKLGDYPTALTFYKKALDFDPEHKSAHEYLGELYVETGDLEKARGHLAILVRLCPTGCEEREDLETAIAAAAPKIK
ncbi:MAG TPA: tetratricopeptide repeat protein [Hyphomicrobiaceae bacterium]|nr:tetratricopeptide repeat protein [Hyphomicrobiaceae bacterium]